MVIPSISNCNNIFNQRYCLKTQQKTSFKGQIEDDFFKAIKDGDTQKQLKCLSNIKFDINATDIETGDNFIHSAIKTGNKQIINKAMILLSQKTNSTPEETNNILNQTKNDIKD